MRDIRPEAFKTCRRIELGEITIVFPPDEKVVHPGRPWIEHECLAGDGEKVLNVVSLHPEHAVFDDGMTVSPSILCKTCGLHGFLKNGEWKSC